MLHSKNHIRVTYGCHTSTYEWHTNDMTYELYWVRYGQHVVRKKIFFKAFFQNIWFVKEFLYYSGCFGLFDNIKKRPGTNFCCTFSAWFFHANTSCLILYQLTNFQCDIFFTGYQTKDVIKFLFRQLMRS